MRVNSLRLRQLRVRALERDKGEGRRTRRVPEAALGIQRVPCSTRPPAVIAQTSRAELPETAMID